MPAGAKVVLLLGSGNRDPREFDRPDEFDIARTDPRILAFGHGAHVVLGRRGGAPGGRRVRVCRSSSPGTPHTRSTRRVEFLHSGNVQGPLRAGRWTRDTERQRELSTAFRGTFPQAFSTAFRGNASGTLLVHVGVAELADASA